MVRIRGRPDSTLQRDHHRQVPLPHSQRHGLIFLPQMSFGKDFGHGQASKPGLQFALEGQCRITTKVISSEYHHRDHRGLVSPPPDEIQYGSDSLLSSPQASTPPCIPVSQGTPPKLLCGRFLYGGHQSPGMRSIDQFRIIFLLSLQSPRRAVPLPRPYDFTPQQTSGVVFNKIKTVILAERYDHATFLLPFPQLDPNFKSHFDNVTNILQEYWNAVPGDCPELKARVVEDTETSRLLDLTKSAFAEASSELQELKGEVQQLLQPPPQHSRSKRIAAITIAGATAAGVGLLTLGAHITGTCIAGVLGAV